MISDERGAKGVLDKQHERLRMQAESILQSIEWIRKEDRLEVEIRLAKEAKRFLDGGKDDRNIVGLDSNSYNSSRVVDGIVHGGLDDKKPMGREIGERDRTKEESKVS